MSAKPIRLLVVDDSAMARRMIQASLSACPEIDIVGFAADPYAARDLILELAPDVITLDIEMPRMDGITFLKLLMKSRPMPVIIMSSLTPAGSVKALEALHAGAVDVLDKLSGSSSGPARGRLLAEKIKAAAGARFRQPVPSPAPRPASHAPARTSSPIPERVHRRCQLILLGASTGGTEALSHVLSAMSADAPGICVVQHIPGYFSKAFAERLNHLCAIEVREAQPGDIVARGLALIAPGGLHMLLRRRGLQLVVELNEGPLVHFQRPAVDILFQSAVKAGAGADTAAALLTGMGADGAAGLSQLHQAGALTVAQNEETCVVFGMPREAIRMGAAEHILPLDEIGPFLNQLKGTAIAHAINYDQSN